MTFDPRADGAPDPDLAASIVWFDALVTNTDRRRGTRTCCRGTTGCG